MTKKKTPSLPTRLDALKAVETLSLYFALAESRFETFTRGQKLTCNDFYDTIDAARVLVFDIKNHGMVEQRSSIELIQLILEVDERINVVTKIKKKNTGKGNRIITRRSDSRRDGH